MDRLAGEALIDLLGNVCANHSHVIPAESYTHLPTPDERLRAITLLQQKAAWLEAEIAERRRAEERLRMALASEREAREMAEAALRLREEFLSTAAHELKTPVTALLGHAQLVLRRMARQGETDREWVEKALQTLTGQAGKLSRLVTQLLDVSRLESGKLTLEMQQTDLAALVEQVVAGVRAWSKKHPIRLEAPPSLDAWIDPLRIEQILTNLLDNAFKYSPEGGPIDVVLCQPDRTFVELSVRDRGLGIPPEQRGQIFDRFYQAHGNEFRSGMGLGLYISRQIAELHGGEIRAEFPPDGGTCFVVGLPASIPSGSASYSRG
jgi:signal transduction histidine kinase